MLYHVSYIFSSTFIIIFRTVVILVGLGIIIIFILIAVFVKWWYRRAGADDEEDEEIHRVVLEEDPVYLQHLELQMIRRMREEAEENARRVESNIYEEV